MEKIRINAAEKGRLDVLLAQNSDLTRSYICKLIEEGNATVNGKQAAKSGVSVGIGDEIELVVPDVRQTVEAKDIPFGIIYEDADVAVIDKPQGLTVHPAGTNYSDTLVNALMFRLDSLSGINGEIRPGIVHRLDKDTSGIMMVAKNDAAHLSLSKQIEERSVSKEYLALLEGNLSSDSGRIENRIGRNPSDRKLMAVTSDGRTAITDYRVLERLNGYTLVLFKILTGRTHQIRVHAKSIGHPVVGDKQYGYKKQKFALSGQLLHAFRLSFTHPTCGKRMTFVAPVPAHFSRVYNALAVKESKATVEEVVEKLKNE